MMYSFLRSREFKILLVMIMAGASMLIFGPGETLDRKFFYTMDWADQWYHSRSEEQIERYIINEYLDHLYLFSYSALFLSLMRRLHKNRLLFIFALLPGMLDLVETWTILGILHESICIPEWLGYLTAVKWSMGYAVMAVLIYSWQRRRTEKRL